MSFHDQVHRDEELASYQAIRQLQLWLQTIAPVSHDVTKEVCEALEKLCTELDYTLVEDEQLNWKILK